MKRSLGHSMLRNLLPGKTLIYSFKFAQSAEGKVSMHCLWQNDFFFDESVFHGFLRKTAFALHNKDRVGLAVCKAVRGIAKRVNELAQLLSKVS